MVSRWHDANELAVAFVGDRTNVALRAEVIAAFQPLVRSIAYKIPSGLLVKMGMNRDDAISESNIAFMHALDRFRPEKGTLVTFAYKTCEGELLHWVRDMTHQRVSTKPRIVSMDPKSREAGREEMEEALAGNGPSVEDVALDRYLAGEVIDAARRVLDPKEFYVLEGLARGRTQKQVGRSLGVSQMHVSRVYRKVIEALRVEMRA